MIISWLLLKREKTSPHWIVDELMGILQTYEHQLNRSTIFSQEFVFKVQINSRGMESRRNSSKWSTRDRAHSNFGKEILEEKYFDEKEAKREWVVLRIAMDQVRKNTSLVVALGRMLLLPKFWALCKWILEKERSLIKVKWKWS